jgi:O-antigen ligase
MNAAAPYHPAMQFRTLFSLLLLSVVAALLTGQFVLMATVPGLLLILIFIKYPRILFLLLLATIPLSMEIKLTPELGTDIPDELLMWFLSAIIPIIIVLQPEKVLPVIRHPLILLLLSGLCWTMITLFYSTHALLSVKYFLAKTWYILPFCLGTILFLEKRQYILLAAKCMVLTMAIATIVVLTRHAFAGFSFEQVNEVARPIFRNHVNYAALLVCMIPVCFALYKNAVRFRYAWLVILLVFLAALFFTYSRGAWLGLAAALITIAFARKKILSWLIGSVSVLVIVAALWFSTNNRYLDFRPVYEQTIYHSNFDEHIEATYAMRDLSTAERFYRWIAAFRMSSERLLTGYGPNSFYYEYKPYAVNSFTTYVSDNQEHSTVHNYFLLLLAEQGIPGLLLFVALFFSMMLYAQHYYHQSQDKWERGLMLVVVSLLGMIGVLIFLSDLMETDKTGSLFYICLGLLVSARTVKMSG